VLKVLYYLKIIELKKLLFKEGVLRLIVRKQKGRLKKNGK
jgi:hypothetical protein